MSFIRTFKGYFKKKFVDALKLNLKDFPDNRILGKCNVKDGGFNSLNIWNLEKITLHNLITFRIEIGYTYHNIINIILPIEIDT